MPNQFENADSTANVQNGDSATNFAEDFAASCWARDSHSANSASSSIQRADSTENAAPPAPEAPSPDWDPSRLQQAPDQGHNPKHEAPPPEAPTPDWEPVKPTFNGPLDKHQRPSNDRQSTTPPEDRHTKVRDRLKDSNSQLESVKVLPKLTLW